MSDYVLRAIETAIDGVGEAIWELSKSLDQRWVYPTQDDIVFLDALLSEHGLAKTFSIADAVLELPSSKLPRRMTEREVSSATRQTYASNWLHHFAGREIVGYDAVLERSWFGRDCFFRKADVK